MTKSSLLFDESAMAYGDYFKVLANFSASVGFHLASPQQAHRIQAAAGQFKKERDYLSAMGAWSTLLMAGSPKQRFAKELAPYMAQARKQIRLIAEKARKQNELLISRGDSK
jgi:hypothetical protein